MNKGMITPEEGDILRRIQEIDPRESAYEILDNPEAFFYPYIKDIKNVSVMILAKFSIYAVLREVDGSPCVDPEENQQFTSYHSVIAWLDKLIGFYAYISDTLNFLIMEHDNSMLDLYNEGHINKETLKKGMAAFAKVKKQFLRDQEDLAQCIEEIEKEKKHVAEFMG